MTGIDELGFLPGWGSTVGRVRESFQLLLDIVQVCPETGMRRHKHAPSGLGWGGLGG